MSSPNFSEMDQPRSAAPETDPITDPVGAATTRPVAAALADRGVQATVFPLGVADAIYSSSLRPENQGTTPSIHVNAQQQAIFGPLHSATTRRPACDTCFARRWQNVRPEILREALEQGSDTRWASDEEWYNPFATDTLAAMHDLVADSVNAESPATASRYSTVFAVDLEDLTVRRQRVVSDPTCPVCSPALSDSRDQAVVALESVPKKDSETFRSLPIDEYPIETDAFANQLCGALGPEIVLDILSETASATIGCLTIRAGSYLRETFWGGHENTFVDSVRVGVLEGLERVAGMQPRGKRTEVVAALDEIDVPVVDPRDCGVYASDFHTLNPDIPAFDPGTPISWVWAWSLRDSRAVLVPEVLAYYHIPGVHNRFVQESSNGCASGGCREESVYFGLMELIERDAFLLAWYGREPLPEIDPRTSTDPDTRLMVDRLEMCGYTARFFDARVTFDIPVVIGVADRVDGGMGTLCFGGGANLDPEAALGAALREIATDAVNAEQRTKNLETWVRPMLDDFDWVQQLHDHPLLYGLPEMRPYAGFLLDHRPPPVSLQQRFEVDRPAPPSSLDLREDIELAVTRVTDAGFDVLVVDQTTPEQQELGLSTCSVVTPGLLPIDFGWRRQRVRTMSRLRTARREAGLRDVDLQPHEINPAPHPFP